MRRSNSLQNHTRLRVSLTLMLAGVTSIVVLVHGPARLASAQSAAASWSYTGSLNIPRRGGHTSTLLPNGKVLIAGGMGHQGPSSFILDSAELFDPANGTWTSTGNLNATRTSHTAMLLPNGKVLVAGGIGNCAINVGCPSHNSAELYDPATGTWSVTGSLNFARGTLTATLLQNGNVLVTGGANNNSAELYDPVTGTWSITGGFHTVRSDGYTATLLPNGKVLVAGGYNDAGTAQFSAELYDPATRAWSITGNPNTGHFGHTATLLPNRKVLVAGGSCQSFFDCDLADELYDPATETWSIVGNFNEVHYGTATLLLSGQVLVVGNPSSIFDPTTATWGITAKLNTARIVPATLLTNGKVLVAGGQTCNSNGCIAFDSAELYDPGTNPTPTPTPTATPTATPTPTPTPTPSASPTWTTSGNLSVGRDSHTATLLPNGKVLVAGGNDSNGTLKSAELYDPSTGTWSNTGNLNTDRAFHTATLLPSGKVLIAGGFSCAPPPHVCTRLNSAELYDPTTGSWNNTGNLNTTRDTHTATLLNNGKVLVVGGSDVNDIISDSAETYDPATGMWSITGSLNTSRAGHTATLLLNGKVLVAGGADIFGNLSSSVELYDPATGTWTFTGSLNAARTGHTATILLTGKVLVAGGDGSLGQVTDSAELYDPDTGQWSGTGSLDQRRDFHTATLLVDGRVLIAGGFFFDGLPNITNSAEQYDPATGTWSNTDSLNTSRRFHTATLLLNGRVLVAGGNGFNAPNSAELYDPGTSTPNQIDDPQFFVRQHYLDFLNRQADTAGLNFWIDNITSCGFDTHCVEVKRIDTSAAFFLSIEFQETGYLVYRIYKSAYGDISGTPVPVRLNEFLPDTQKIGQGVIVNQTGWEQVLENNKQAFTAEFVQRSRFTSLYSTSLTPDQFIDQLFMNAGVTPSAADRASAINEFGSAMTTADTAARGRSLRLVAENSTLAQQEFNKAFVLMQYFGYLRRNPNDPPEPGLNFAGYNFWLTKLNQFNGDFRNADMVKSFLVSTEYRQRFGQP